MSADPEPDENVQHRAEQLIEERATGTADPQDQAAAILEESRERTEVPDAAPSSHLERRTSEEAS